MEQKKEVNSSSNKGWAKVIISSIFLILILVLIFYVFSGSGSGKRIEYSQFQNDLSNGYVKQIEFGASKVELTYFDGSRYWFYNRSSFEVSALELVEQFNADVESGASGTETFKKVTIVPGSTTTFSILNLLYPILLLVATGVLIYFVFKKMGNINNKSFDFVKNRARIIPSNTKFENVAGVDEEKEELKEIIEFLRNPKKYIDIGARIPKGVLLVGPPGTGKTLLAKAIAGEAEVPFFSISGSDFMELFVGVGASRVRDLFENAKKAKPCIVFIDEIDAVGRQRGAGMGGGNDEREQTLNQLLVQMDGFEENEGIIVIAATNRADILDPALMRPGRFDRQIYVHAPDVRGREEILKVHAKNKPLASDVDLKVVARITSGFTGADLENLLNESAILAARENRTEISMQDINNGIVKVTMGPQKRSRIVSEKDRRITAVHESGHAIIERLVENNNPVHEVSIVPRGGAGGYTLSRPDNDDEYMSKRKLIDTITMFLGGRTAEKLFLDDITTGASNDIERATDLARKMVTLWGMSENIGNVSMGSSTSLFLGRDYQERVNYSEKEAANIDAEIKKIMDTCTKKAEEILSNNKKVLLTMVDVLLEKETIYSDEVNMIINGASKEEVCSFIDNKNKASKETKVEKQEKSDEPKTESEVDKLLKTAQARTKKLEQSNIQIDEKDKKDVRLTKTAQENSQEKEQTESEKQADAKSLSENAEPKKAKRGRPPKNGGEKKN